MKYMLMIYQNSDAWKSLSESERISVMNEAGEIMNELTASGEWVGGEALADSSAAKSVRVRNGEAIVTDGPYIESREQLAGFLIVECETPERAAEIAKRWPDARYWGMEVRPLMHGSSGDV